MENDDWFKVKHYCHIGEPLSSTESKKFIRSYVKNKNAIVHHAFFPLIRKCVLKNKYHTENKDEKRLRKKKTKIRYLSYATNVDAAIYSYYALKLSILYNKYLIYNGLTDNVIAYRKIKDFDNHGKCNIDFANEIFDFILLKLIKYDEVAVVTFDIKGFFDNLDHKHLRESLKLLLCKKTLDEDYYAIYKNVIKYSYVDIDALFEIFKSAILCKNKLGSIVERKVNKIKYLRDKNAIAFCRRNNIDQIKASGIIQRGNYDKKKKQYTHMGIPQGLPISAVLANIYMIKFDKAVFDQVSLGNAIYRRYSDDIVIVCPKNKEKSLKDFIQEEISNVRLEIEASKTRTFYFKKDKDGRITCIPEKANEKFEYLGFSFDGNKVFIKDSSLSRYYQKIKRNLKREVYYAETTSNKDTQGKLFKKKLLLHFTKLGARKHRIFVRKKDGTFYPLMKRSMGNFRTYTEKAQRIFGPSNDIKHQLRNNPKFLKKRILKAEEALKNNIDKKHNYQLIKYGRTY